MRCRCWLGDGGGKVAVELQLLGVVKVLRSYKEVGYVGAWQWTMEVAGLLLRVAAWREGVQVSFEGAAGELAWVATWEA